MSMTDVPEGFVLDSSFSDSTSGEAKLRSVPEGFVLDTPGAVPNSIEPAAPLKTVPLPPGFVADAEIPPERNIVSRSIDTVAKGVPHGTVNLGAGALKGLGTLATGARQDMVGVFDRIDKGEKLSIQEDSLGYGDMDEEGRRALRARFVNNPELLQPQQDPLFRAGTTIESAAPTAPRDTPTIAGKPVLWDLSSGLGSLAGGIGLSMIPGVGIPLAGLTFTTAGSGEAAERAIKAGATPEQITRAARFGTAAGATDLADILLPSFFGSTGRAAAFVGKVGVNAVKAAFVEGGQEGLQQLIQNSIAKGIYKPDQDLMEDVPYNAFIGAVLGGGVTTIAGKLQQDQQKNAEQEPLRTTLQDIERVLSLPTQRFSEAGPGPIWTSTLRDVAATKLPNSATPEQMLATIKNQPRVKKEEIEATGLDEFLASRRGKVTKQEVVEYLEERQVRVEEVIKSEIGSTLGERELARLSHELDNLNSEYNWIVDNRQTETEDAKRVSARMAEIEDRIKVLIGARGPVGSINTDQPTQFGEYQTPGPRQNYRELLLTLPPQPNLAPDKALLSEFDQLDYKDRVGQGLSTIERVRYRELTSQLGRLEGQNPQNHQSSHWSEPNVLAHVRFSEREDLSGRPMLFVEEIQSDWHQAGREQGYGTGLPEGKWTATQTSAGPGQHSNRWTVDGPDGSRFYVTGTRTEIETIRDAQEQHGRRQKIPNAPFKTSWPDLALKRMIRWAADNGFSRIALPTGDRVARNMGVLNTIPEPGNNPFMEAHNTHYGPIVVGMREFYDKILPSRMRRFAKELGGSYGESRVITNSAGEFPGIIVEGQQFPTEKYTAQTELIRYIEISKSAMTKVQAGLPMFSRAGPDVRFRVSPEAKAAGTFSEYYRQGPKIAAVFVEMMRKFDIRNRTDITFIDDPNSRNLGNVTPWTDGSFIVEINLAAHENLQQLYSTVMHEFGHIVAWEKFNELPVSKKLAIMAAYAKFREENPINTRMIDLLRRRDNAVVNFYNNKGTSTRPLNQLTPEQIKYWTEFDEWFAEQVARWATSSEPALGVVEKFFKNLGKQLLAIFKFVSSRFGMNYQATPVIQEWLDSFMDSAPPLSAIVQEAQDQSRRTNQYALDTTSKDVPAVPIGEATLSIRENMRTLFADAVPADIREAGAHADRMNSFYKYMHGVDQLVDLNPHFTPLLRYAERVREMHLDETKIHDAALRIGKEWRRLGKQGENLTALIDGVVNMTYRTDQEVKQGVGRHPTGDEFQALLKKHKVEPKTRDTFNRVRKMFDGFLTLIEGNAIAEANRLITNPVALQERIGQIQAQTANLRSRPYFPFMRFGRYFVTVKNAAGRVVHFQTVERKGLSSAQAQQRKLRDELQGKLEPGERIEIGVLPEVAEPFIGMPPLLLEQMLRSVDLTPAQQDAVRQLSFDLSPAMSFKHRFQHKDYTPGYSIDFKRSFARYFFHGARYYTKVKYGWALRGDVRSARVVGGNKAGLIADYMADHLQNTVLDAKGDYGIFKAGIFFWALGFVPASALLNMSQTPMITLPFLAAKFGDVRAIGAMISTMSDITSFYRKGKYDNLTDFEMRAISYGIKTGRISETQAPELAGLAQGANLIEGLAGNKAQRAKIHVMQSAAFMFEMAEQFNRRIAFRAALKLAIKNPDAKGVKEALNKYSDEYGKLQNEGFTQAEAAAIVTAAHATDQTQFVYARYARPRFMRGRLSGTLLVFKKYMQSVLALLGANKSDVLPRFLVMSLVMGGLFGVPGADDMKELARALAHWLFGKEFSVERAAREWILEWFNGKVPPDLILHGLSRYGFGVPALLDMMGSLYTGKPGRGLTNTHSVNVPYPILDRSRALSMGNILPFEVGKVFGPPVKDQERMMMEQVQKASGAVFGTAFNIYKALMDKDQEYNDPKRWERAVPRALGSTSRAFRAFTEGRERSRGGPNSASTITNFDPRDTEHMMEILAMAAGYQPLRVQAQWDRIIAQKEVDTYWNLQRNGLLVQMFEAISGAQPKEVERVRNSIMQFNKELPDFAKGKIITSDTIKKSMDMRARQKDARESGVPVQKTSRGVAERIQRLFPESTVDVRRVK